VHKRLWELTEDHVHLDEAVRGYERGFYLRNDYYNGINFAYLLNVAAMPPPARRGSRLSGGGHSAPRRRDRLLRGRGKKYGREVLEICDTVLETETLTVDDRYWVLATMAEALPRRR